MNRSWFGFSGGVSVFWSEAETLEPELGDVRYKRHGSRSKSNRASSTPCPPAQSDRFRCYQDHSLRIYSCYRRSCGQNDS